MSRYSVKISHHELKAMMDLIKVYHVDVSDHGSRRGKHGQPHVAYASASPEEIQTLRNAGYAVEQRQDLDAHNRAAQSEVGKGNRYKKQS
jgi:hypothetical protein